jgi:YfiH family protein
MDSKTSRRLRDTAPNSEGSRAEYLQSRLLSSAGFRHAFFTRRGGVSGGAYAALNFSSAVGDAEDKVSENFRRAGNALGLDSDRLFFLAQVHGREVRQLTGNESFEQICNLSGDALVSICGNLACCVRVADCVPVLLGDIRSGAAGAAHAGWRGVVARVVPATVETLGRVSGGEPTLVAAIGPHISVAAFEVSADVAAQLADASSASNVVDWSWGERPHVNLRRIVRAQLVNAGVAEECIDDVDGCTVGDPDRFFSFRRDGRHSGRHLAAIVPR